MTQAFVRMTMATIAALAIAAAPGSAAIAGEVPLLVDAAWVAQRVGAPRVILLHVGDRANYARGHLPGARSVTEDDLSLPHDMARGELMLELPAPDVLRSRLAGLGISDDSVIVVYAGADVALQSATRIMFTLDYVGLGDQSALLDGGLSAWKAAGRQVTTATTNVTPGSLPARAVAPVVADAAAMQAMARKPDVKLIDARAPVFYRGTEPTFGKRGHIPGAASIPFSAITDNTGRVVPRGDLERLFANAGVKPGDTVLAYCHVGQQATAVLFAARLLGHRVVLYDGAFQDWATNNRGAVE